MQELQYWCAHNAITKCVMRYMRGLDRLDAGTQMSAFHDDATVDFGFFTGSARDFVGFAQSLLRKYDKTFHMLGQMDIEVDIPNGTGVGEIYFSALHRIVEDGSGEDLLIAGRYRDRYEQRDGRWAISERLEVVDWTRTDSARDDWLDRTPEAIVGCRDGEAGIARRRGIGHA